MGIFGGLMWVFEEVARQVEEELFDDEKVKAELVEAYRQLESGVLTEEQFTMREALLVQRLDDIEERRKERA